MIDKALPEVWLRGPLAGVPPLLQPAAHALLQAVEEVRAILTGFPASQLWERPAGVASIGFHLQHLAGVVHRMGTYAQGQPLDAAQLAALGSECLDQGLSLEQLISAWENRVTALVEQMRTTDETTLTDFRAVGRKGLPSTVIGLLFHAAEHSQRHLGQLLVTARLLTIQSSS
jgi:uncharacterized damage-inducible protein DinB